MNSRVLNQGVWRMRWKFLAWIAIVLLAGCTPDYNWRQMVVADGHVEALFPARVDSETRTLLLAGQTLPFTLAVAQVGQTMFAVGSAPIPDELELDRAARERMGQVLMRSLYANLGAAVPAVLPPLGEEIEVRGRVGQRLAWVRARVWVTNNMLIEAVVSGGDDEASREEVDTFLREVRIKSHPGP